MRIERDNFYDAWTKMLSTVMQRGHVVKPRGMEVREVIGTQLYVHSALKNIVYHPIRDLNYRFLVAEWLWTAAGREDVAFLARYNKGIGKYSDDGVRFGGAYGPRLAPQWGYLIDCLKKDPDSRQAVATIFTPNPGPTKDVPCTLSLQFFIRRGEMHTVATMRSQDLWLGLTIDFFNFSMLANLLSFYLGFPVGSLTLNVGSSHVYSTDYDKVAVVVENDRDGQYYGSPQFSTVGCPHPSLLLKEVEESLDDKETPRVTPVFSSRMDALYADVLLSSNKAEALEILKGA